MIQLAVQPLPTPAARQLKAWQRELKDVASYADQVSLAATRFAGRNRPTNATFASVRAALTHMCSGARRCCYCEDSVADEVEHIWPKNLYPGLTFVWGNYIYACGACNGPKRSKFAVLPHGANAIHHIVRIKNVAPARPLRGAAALINPRTEDPLRFLELDLRGTFQFNPRIGLSARDRERALYTREILGLNSRDYLSAARSEAYDSYLSRLRDYITDRDSGATVASLTRRVDALLRMQHPTVWKEMQRQHGLIQELTDAFNNAPEALLW